MHIMTDGIVLREQTIKDFDSILTLLTKERGVITVYARGVRKPRGALRAPTELLSCSCFVLFSSKDKYTLDKADLNRLFMGIRADVEKLSLACYLCELTADAAPREESAEEVLRLLLNTLHLLDKDKRTCEQLKPIFELRLMAMMGFLPDLVGCKDCRCFEAEPMYFLPESSGLLCPRCLEARPGVFQDFAAPAPLPSGVLTAMRHICYADNEKLFQFMLPQPGLRLLNEITERYVMLRLEKRFSTFAFYESMRA